MVRGGKGGSAGSVGGGCAVGGTQALTWPKTSGVGVWIIAVAFQILSASFFKRMIE